MPSHVHSLLHACEHTHRHTFEMLHKNVFPRSRYKLHMQNQNRIKKIIYKKRKRKKREQIPTEVKRLKSGITQQHYCVQCVAVRDVSSLQLINMQHSLGSAPLTPVITIS